MSERDTAAARLAASWLLSYPDDRLESQLVAIRAVAAELPADMGAPLEEFITHVDAMPMGELQAHYVLIFDMRRKACPYLTYWTDGDTRNRGMALLHFKQAYQACGYDLGNEELADHLSVVLEFAAVGDRLTGEALLAEHQEPIRLLRDALARMESPYVHVLDCVVATLPAITPEVRERMAQLAAAGPPTESVGLEGYTSTLIETIGVRR